LIFLSLFNLHDIERNSGTAFFNFIMVLRI